MTSRPLPSAPRKYWPCQVGPVGTPSKETTWTSSPPMFSVSAIRWRLCVVCATWSAYTGASSAMAMSRMKRTPNASAVRLRRSRRQARRQGPMPAVRWSAAAPSSSKAVGASDGNSVSGSVVMADLPGLAKGMENGRMGGAPSRAPPIPPRLALQGERGVDGLQHRMEQRVLEVHPIRHDERQDPVAVRHHVALAHQLLVDGRVLRCGLLDVLLVGLGEHGVDLGIVHVAEVLVVRVLDRVAVDQEHEVVRVRIVLEPVREARSGLRVLVADRLEVHIAVDDPQLGLEPDLLEDVGEVLRDVARELLVVAVHRDALAGSPCLLDELLGLLDVRRRLRVTVRARLDLLVALHAGRQEVAVRVQQATEQ